MIKKLTITQRIRSFMKKIQFEKTHRNQVLNKNGLIQIFIIGYLEPLSCVDNILSGGLNI